MGPSTDEYCIGFAIPSTQGCAQEVPDSRGTPIMCQLPLRGLLLCRQTSSCSPGPGEREVSDERTPRLAISSHLESLDQALKGD